jgi:hypothetical protein
LADGTGVIFILQFAHALAAIFLLQPFSTAALIFLKKNFRPFFLDQVQQIRRKFSAFALQNHSVLLTGLKIIS